MLELSEEEEISCSAEQKHPRGSQTCLTLIPHVSSDTSTIFTIVAMSSDFYKHTLLPFYKQHEIELSASFSFLMIVSIYPVIRKLLSLKISAYVNAFL